MSDDPKDKKKLLPEILPAPQAAAGATPKQRVNERARLLLQRFRGLGTTAGAAILSLQCTGYGVVDPLPPPPQQCSALPDPFTHIVVTGSLDYDRVDGGAPPLVVRIMSLDTTGISAPTVLVTAGGTLISMEDVSTTTDQGLNLLVKIALSADLPDGSTTAVVQFEIDVVCGDAASTKRYQALISTPISAGQFVSVVAQ